MNKEDWLYIEVVMANHFDQAFTYKIRATDKVEVGGIVQVDFAFKEYAAVVISVDITPNYDRKKIKAIKYVRCVKYFSDELLKVLYLAADYYVHSLGEVLYTALPPQFRQNQDNREKAHLIALEFAAKLEQPIARVLAQEYHELLSLISTTNFTSEHLQQIYLALNQLDYDNFTLSKTADKILKEEFKAQGLTFTKTQLQFLCKLYLYQVYLSPLLEYCKKSNLNQQRNYTNKQKKTTAIPKLNLENGKAYVVPSENKEFYSLTLGDFAVIQEYLISLERFNWKKSAILRHFLTTKQLELKEYFLEFNSELSKGYSKQEIPTWFIPYLDLPVEQRRQAIVNLPNKLTLNQEQQAVFNNIISNSEFKAVLINGVTGSGKTEVYLQLIEYYLLQGKSCLVLVPEIGLTPQTVNRFRNRFNTPMAILHSNVTDRDKNIIVQQCLEGEISIIIGTRSSIFTQLQNLGCIIIDEEHDSSYKQQSDFRYHARDLALLRGQLEQIPIIMGTATPSFSSLANVETGKFTQLFLHNRAQAQFPTKVQLIDLHSQNFMGVENKADLMNKAGVSQLLWHYMQEELVKGNQVLLFLNRRGYAPLLTCQDCGNTISCPECTRPLTYHRRSHDLKCHVCHISVPIPTQCPSCGSSFLIPKGAGTEQIERLTEQLYDPQRIIRIDRDTSRNQKQLESHLERVSSTPGAILIGTQMLAKGHHFPDVTLVGLLNIDGLVLGTDFRAAERVAQLYVQVAGRAGRESKQGYVFLQTSFPHLPIYTDLLGMSYANFAQKYLAVRKSEYKPPYTYQAYFGIRAKDEYLVNDNISYLLNLINQAAAKLNQEITTTGKPKLEYAVEVHDVGMQNNFYRKVVDLIVSNRSYRSLLVKEVRNQYLSSEVYRSSSPIFYLDIDPIDL